MKPDCLFRSGALSELSDRDLERLSALNLDTIIDFRRKSEIHHSPNRLPDQLRERQQQLNIEPGSLIDAFSSLSPEHVNQHMIDINRALVLEHRQPYSTFLHRLLEVKEGALLFHCTAGKDRTGFAAALVLMALEVPREVIFEDYLLTGEYFVAEEQASRFLQNPQLKGSLGQFSNDEQVSKEILMPMLQVKREYLQSAFNTIDQNFDSESNYLTETFGFDRDKQRTLQDLYLE